MKQLQDPLKYLQSISAFANQQNKSKQQGPSTAKEDSSSSQYSHIQHISQHDKLILLPPYFIVEYQPVLNHLWVLNVLGMQINVEIKTIKISVVKHMQNINLKDQIVPLNLMLNVQDSQHVKTYQFVPLVLKEQMDLVYGLMVLVIVILHVKVQPGILIVKANKQHFNAQPMKLNVLALQVAETNVNGGCVTGQMVNASNLFQHQIQQKINANYTLHVLMHSIQHPFNVKLQVIKCTTSKQTGCIPLAGYSLIPNLNHVKQMLTNNKVTSTGVCTWDTIAKSCRDQVCSDLTFITHSACNSTLSTCTSNETACLNQGNCSTYTTDAACNNGVGLDGICFWVAQNGTTAASCRLQTCDDVQNGTSNSVCSLGLSSCISDALDHHITQASYNSGGSDGTCVWKSATTETTTAGSCSLMTSCASASQDQNACNAAKFKCSWTPALLEQNQLQVNVKLKIVLHINKQMDHVLDSSAGILNYNKSVLLLMGFIKQLIQQHQLKVIVIQVPLLDMHTFGMQQQASVEFVPIPLQLRTIQPIQLIVQQQQDQDRLLVIALTYIQI